MTQTNEQLLQVVRDQLNNSHRYDCSVMSMDVVDLTKCNCGRDEALSALAELEARLKDSDRDAARYRKLREVDADEYGVFIAKHTQNGWGNWLTYPIYQNEADETVDALPQPPAGEQE